jgi:hypothetical protein
MKNKNKVFFIFTDILQEKKHLFYFGTSCSLLSTRKRKFNKLKKSPKNGREL